MDIIKVDDKALDEGSAPACFGELGKLEIEFRGELEKIGAAYTGPEVRVSECLGLRVREVGGW